MTEEQLDHDAALDLAALALDGPLPPPYEERLAAHLVGCDACRATEVAMRRDARVLGELPRADAPPRVRDAVVRGAADADGRRRPSPLGWLARGLRAGGAFAFAVGAFLLTLIALALMVATGP